MTRWTLGLLSVIAAGLLLLIVIPCNWAMTACQRFAENNGWGE